VRHGPDLTSRLRGHETVRAALALLVTIAAVVAGNAVRHSALHKPALHPLLWTLIIVILVAGGFGVRWLALVLGKFVTRRTVLAAGAVVRFVATGIGYVVLLLTALAVVGVSLQRLLIGAGLVSVVLGIAAQQSLANIFASLVLLFARPFSVGDYIVIRSGTLGVIQCEVKAIGLTYVTVHTDTGFLKIPNSVMSAAAIGRVSPPVDEAP
jgi:small-conductance mechanosensitive channel